MSKIIFFGNYKGGVGKTTSVFSVAHYLAKEFDKKVLMIDIDPQSSLSEICIRNNGSWDKLKDVPANETLNYIFDLSIRRINRYSNISLNFNAHSLIKGCRMEGVHFIPTSLYYEGNLGLDELSMKMTNSIEYFSILPQFLSELEQFSFDYILVDCPPTSNIITQSAFLMSDYYMIPTVEDGISTNGVLHYIHTIGETYNRYCTKQFDDYLFYKHFFKDKPQLLGVFYTLSRGQVNYTEIEQDFETELANENLSEKDIYVFRAYTDNFVNIARQIAIGNVAGIVNGKESYKDITHEMFNRIVEIEAG